MKFTHLGYAAEGLDKLTLMDCVIQSCLHECVKEHVWHRRLKYIREMYEKERMILRGDLIQRAVRLCNGKPRLAGIDPAKDRAFFTQTMIARIAHLETERIIDTMVVKHGVKLPTVFVGWHEEYPRMLCPPSERAQHRSIRRRKGDE